ncbi:hypothetical protein BZA77DRAFT_306652 [Pyronema omphalodes]|nr:hypothetical protein BZA77DRAFT_321276 [Pyronema omphalodes]KAI5818324.1 hypothetical protein BZA77DRAFT_306652 [Pyronema omphalodes]
MLHFIFWALFWVWNLDWELDKELDCLLGSAGIFFFFLHRMFALHILRFLFIYFIRMISLLFSYVHGLGILY